MKISTTKNIPDKTVEALIVSLLLFSLFLNLGVHPLYLEEPRRALIALEMIFRDNFIVPTEWGEYYYKKPPLYNWVLVGSYKMFGNYSEFATRFFSVVSFIMMGLLIFLCGKKYIGKDFGTLSAILFLISADIFFYFSVTGEIDLFYSFITFAGLISIFHFYESKSFYALFIVTYFLHALGTLTKGFPSIVFLGISLPLFFLYRKDFKKLFTLAHLAGIFVFSVIVGVYFYYYSRYNSLQYYFHDLWSQSSERTVMEKSVWDMIKHLFLFPLETLKNVLPASLLVIFLFHKNLMTTIRQNKFILFCLIIFIGNIFIYWISPGTRSRYVYMLYPFPVIILTYFYRKHIHEKKKLLLHWIAGLIILISIPACLALPFIPQLKSVENLWPVAFAGAISMSLLSYLFYKQAINQLMALILTIIIVRIIFDIVVLPERATLVHKAAKDKEDARIITNIVKTEPLFIFAEEKPSDLYNKALLSFTTGFYIVREKRQILKVRNDKNPAYYYLAEDNQIVNDTFEVYYEFMFNNRKFLLIKFLP